MRFIVLIVVVVLMLLMFIGCLDRLVATQRAVEKGGGDGASNATQIRSDHGGGGDPSVVKCVRAWLGMDEPPSSAAMPVGNDDGDGDDPFRPWPPSLSSTAFHGLAGEFVNAILPHTEADPVALLLQFLAATGNAMRRTSHFVPDGGTHFTNIFTVMVGPTGSARKGTSWSWVEQVVGAADMSWSQRVVGGLSSGEGLIWAVRDAIHQNQRDKKSGESKNVELDPGISDKRLMVVESEFSSVLKVLVREGNTLSHLIRKAWDTGDLQSMTKNSPAKASKAHITIIGHVTRHELIRSMVETDMFNGFGNRFIWACVRRSKVLPEGGAVNRQQIAALASRLTGTLRFATSQAELKRDAAARELWIDEYPQLTAARTGVFGAMTNRAAPQVMRLSLIYALLDQSPVIRLAHLQAALAVWAYAEASIRYIFGDTPGDRMATIILNALKARASGMTRTEIRDLFGRNKTKAAIDDALRTLTDGGQAMCLREASTGIKPIERWRVT